VDLRELDALQKLLSELSSETHCLIHCSAIRSEDARPLSDTDPLQFKRVFDENFYPAYNVLRAVLPQMLAQRFGRVVLFSSEVTRSGLAKGSAYAAAKAAIANLAKSAALECASANVLINSIAPAPVDTALEDDFSGGYLAFRKAYFARHIAHAASQQLVSIAEIKQVSDLLISEELRSLCGEEIFLSGGKL
jgi:NAD(P)-dependent dehydrogenase (short-subunit alcohol dehydrogenase family)